MGLWDYECMSVWVNAYKDLLIYGMNEQRRFYVLRSLQRINSSTHKLIHPSTHSPINSSTQLYTAPPCKSHGVTRE